MRLTLNMKPTYDPSHAPTIIGAWIGAQNGARTVPNRRSPLAERQSVFGAGLTEWLEHIRPTPVQGTSLTAAS